MARLILHSDDFGLHPEVNRGILEAARHGALTSTSLLVNGLATEQAITSARDYPQLGVGLHLNIVRGRPLAAPETIPTLVDERGYFFNSAATLLLRSLTRRLSVDDVHREYRLQLSYMLDHGLSPTHLDGEKHTHLLLPETVEAVRRLQDEFGIPRVRLIRERTLNKTLRARGIQVTGTLQQRLKLALLEYRARRARSRLPAAQTPDLTYGVLDSGSTQVQQALAVLRCILEFPGETSVEWMFHLGYPFDVRESSFRAEFGSFFLDDSRKAELEFLVLPATVELLRDNKEKLISYRDL